MLFTLLLACTAGEEDPLLTDPGSSGSCTLFIPEALLDFGRVYVAGETAERRLRVRNDGDAECVLRETQLVGEAEDFSVPTQDLQALGPGETRDLLLHYIPRQDGADQAELHILSNDTAAPTHVIELQGDGLAPRLEASIQEQTEPVMLGCTEEFVLLLSNRGSVALQVEALSLVGAPDLAWSESSQAELSKLPLSVGPGESRALTLLFAPLSADSAQEGTLQILSSDPEEPSVAVSFKAAVDQDAHEQRFELPLQPKTDVLFVVDWLTTDTKLVPFLGAFGTFRKELTALNLDYQISAVVQSEGCHIGGSGPVTQDLSAEAQDARFIEQACSSVDTCPLDGPDSERAFVVAERAAGESNAGAGGCNEGLFRDDAELHIISISDEAEQSYEEMSVHLARLQSLRENPSDVVLHGIGGPAPRGCADADFYDRYYQATLLTGGVFRSICEPDMDAHMSAFAQGVVPQLNPFELDALPVLESIELAVDGVAIESGWSVDLEALTLSFSAGAEPARGSEVVLSYASPPLECRD